jgi:hypothetical protein
LALARSFGRLDLSRAAAAGTRQPDRTFFNLLGTRTIHYSHAVAIASAALAVLLFLAVVVLGLRRGRLSPFGLWQGFLSFFGVLIAVPVVVTLIWFLVRDAASVPVVMNSTRQAAFFMIAFACLALSLFACLFRFFRRGTSALNLAVGAQLWWVLLVLLTSGLWLPAQSNFLFVWPLLGSLLAAAYLIRTPRMAQRPWLTVVVLSLAALPGLLLVAPTTALLYVSFQSLAQLGGTALTLEVLLLGLLIPHLDALMSLRFRWLPALSTLAGLVFLGIALWSPGKAELPRVESSVLYAWDVDAGQRFWFSYDPAPNAWTRQFGFASGRRESFTRFLPLLPQKLMRSPAPAADVPQPVVEVLEQSEHGDVRELRLRLRTAANSQVRFIWFDPPEAVISARLGGTPVVLTGSEPGVAPLLMRLQVPVPEEEMTLRLKGKGAVTMTVVEQLDGLPNVLGLRPRSPEMMPRPFLTAVRSDVTLVRRSFSLVAPGATEAPVPGGN